MRLRGLRVRRKKIWVEAGKPEGETETPETLVLWSEVVGVSVNLDGGSHCERVQAVPEGKAKRQEKKVKKFRARKGKKAIRVESKETQEYVREAKDLSQEEAEINVVPSAISVPQKPLFRCDNRCSEKPSASGSRRRW